MNKKKRIKKLELENFNLKNRVKSLEYRLWILEQKLQSQLFYTVGSNYPYYDDVVTYPPTYDDSVTAPTWDTQTVTNESYMEQTKRLAKDYDDAAIVMSQEEIDAIYDDVFVEAMNKH